jgi:dual specificity tyrosine-phosphorylation-regulated kinase 2/3/4
VNFPDYLQEREQLEIMSYPNVCFLRRNPPRVKTDLLSIPNFYPFERGDHIGYRYEQEAVIGKGSFGSVLRCFDHKARVRVAIKLLRDKPEEHAVIVQELDFLVRLQGSYVVRYLDSFVFRGFYAIVMELNHDDMYAYMRKGGFRGLPLKKARVVAAQVAQCLDHMHAQNVVHADVKPENILWASPECSAVRLIDFGCSCFDGKSVYSYIQSRFYRSPEVVIGIPYGKEIDLWSLGTVVVELLTGSPVFPAETEADLMAMVTAAIGSPGSDVVRRGSRANAYFDAGGVLTCKHRASMARGSLRAKLGGVQDEQAFDFICRLIKWAPEDRMTASQAVQHSWIAGYG